MRLYSNSYLAIILSAPLAATLACQSAQKPSSFMPPAQAQAPAVIAASRPPAHQQKPTAAAAEPQSKPQVPQALEVDPIGDLIARVEKEYQSGQDNYRAGHLEAAKQNFDSAFNQLLGSGFDLSSDLQSSDHPSDDRLQRELDRILDGINSLELAALQQGDGFAEQKSEPAPIDEANELTPTVDQNVKAKAEAELKSTHSDLPLAMTDQVAGYINYFSSRGRGTLERALARSGRYEDMIRRTLREEGVPQDLIYLAQAESGFHPLAVSRAGARGMWQFMGSRAHGYGLERNWWVDDRQDPEKATRAAAHHLKDLYNEFGDWYLAMAAYNSGPGTVQTAVKRTGYADFWELYRRNVLPKETRNYVPIIVAVTIMAKNPAQYGLDSVVKEKPVPYDTIKIGYPIDLRLAAECVDATTSDLLDLNPSLLRLTTPKFPGKEGDFEFHVPAGTAAKFQTAVAAIPVDKRVSWRYHKVQGGETLASIAHTYHTTPTAIAEANDLSDSSKSGSSVSSNAGSKAGLKVVSNRGSYGSSYGGSYNEALAPESRLIIPISPSKQTDTSTYAHATTRYQVRKGDTVESVAENFGVSAKMIRSWNHLKGSSLAGRKVLYLHLPVTRGAGETQVATKRSSGSRHHAGTETASARRSSIGTPNRASSRSSKETSSRSSKETSSAAVHAAVKHHKVKQGETLYSIANSYNTTVSALKKDNRNLAALRPGMILVIRAAR
ncbi:MAG TPA: transglycosylase SLT domain-containing protein [Terriglobales bacterium]|nr:transglycosylase SLT domain-containing protein [Terriglobales bacterium]